MVRTICCPVARNGEVADLIGHCGLRVVTDTGRELGSIHTLDNRSSPHLGLESGMYISANGSPTGDTIRPSSGIASGKQRLSLGTSLIRGGRCGYVRPPHLVDHEQREDHAERDEYFAADPDRSGKGLRADFRCAPIEASCGSATAGTVRR